MTREVSFQMGRPSSVYSFLSMSSERTAARGLQTSPLLHLPMRGMAYLPHPWHAKMVCKKGGLTTLSGDRLFLPLSSMVGERLDFSTVVEAQGAKIAFAAGGECLPFPLG